MEIAFHIVAVETVQSRSSPDPDQSFVVGQDTINCCLRESFVKTQLLEIITGIVPLYKSVAGKQQDQKV